MPGDSLRRGTLPESDPASERRVATPTAVTDLSYSAMESAHESRVAGSEVFLHEHTQWVVRVTTKRSRRS